MTDLLHICSFLCRFSLHCDIVSDECVVLDVSCLGFCVCVFMFVFLLVLGFIFSLLAERLWFGECFLGTYFHRTHFLCRFGSRRIGHRTGIIFNDEMNDFFSPKPLTYANRVEPCKRPQSSMSPAIILDPHGDIVLVIGASGSTKITSATAYVRLVVLYVQGDSKVVWNAFI